MGVHDMDLHLAHTDSTIGARHAASEFFAQRVRQLSGGRLNVVIHPRGALGSDPDALKKVQSGEIDFSMAAAGLYSMFVKAYDLTSLPYLVETYEQGWRLYDTSSWVAQREKELANTGLRVLGNWESGFRSFTMNKKLERPQDAKSLGVRTFPSELITQVMATLGFRTKVIDVNKTRAAIRKGQVNGQENPIDTIFSLRFFEEAPHLVMTKHIYSPLPFCFSEKRWNQLTPDDQDALSRAGREAAEFSRRMVRNLEAFQISEMQVKGVSLTEPDITTWKSALKPVYDWARSTADHDLDGLLADAAHARGP